MRVTVNQFLSVLTQADLVTVDGGPFLHNWEVEEVTHTPENEVVRFSWTDGDYEYCCTLSEGMILNGYFREDNTFVCSETIEDDTEIRFFTISQIVPSF